MSTQAHLTRLIYHTKVNRQKSEIVTHKNQALFSYKRWAAFGHVSPQKSYPDAVKKNIHTKNVVNSITHNTRLLTENRSVQDQVHLCVSYQNSVTSVQPRSTQKVSKFKACIVIFAFVLFCIVSKYTESWGFRAYRCHTERGQTDDIDNADFQYSEEC